MTLEELAAIVRSDRARMPELVALSRRLLADPDPQTRTEAAAMAFYAVRQVLPVMTIAERTALCVATLVELDAAIARGLVGAKRMLGRALRDVLMNAIAQPVETDELLGNGRQRDQ
jgi:hypothetical protein